MIKPSDIRSGSPSDRLSTRELAKLLSLSPETIKKYRKRGCGPTPMKGTGRKIQYRRMDVLVWLECHPIGKSHDPLLYEQRKGFDYTRIRPRSREHVKHETARIKRLLSRQLDHRSSSTSLAIGQALLAVRRLICNVHTFNDWLKQESTVSEEDVTRHISCAETEELRREEAEAEEDADVGDAYDPPDPVTTVIPARQEDHFYLVTVEDHFYLVTVPPDKESVFDKILSEMGLAAALIPVPDHK